MAELSLLARLLVFYGTRLPDHPKKWWLHERLRRLFRVAVDDELEVVRNGLKWRLNPADYTDSSLFWLGSREPWDIFHLGRLLKPGAVIFDVGANFGYYSIMIAAALNRQCSIFAFEPNSENFKRLQRHVESNGLAGIIRAIPLGVSDREETSRMHRPSENSGHAMIDPQGNPGEIQLSPLDVLRAETGVKDVDLLILDVEGYEERALKGAKETLMQFKPIVFIELFPPVMSRQGTSPEAAAALLTDLGYQLYVAWKNRLLPLTELPFGDARENVFCFHENHIPRDLIPAAGQDIAMEERC